MTPDLPNPDDPVRSAIARATRGLPAGEPRAHIFFEERVDSRMRLASSGLRELVTTRIRGAAVTGRESLHLTEPSFLDTLGGQGTKDWVAGLAAAVFEAGNAARTGRRLPSWSARIVTFDQRVWVGQPSGDVVHDLRSGRKLELRAEVGVGSSSYAIQELVLRSADLPPILDAFVRAFDRAETRATVVTAPESGLTTAVFAPGVGGIVVHELVGHALEGDVVARGPTWISTAELPEALRPVTVVDDPRRGRGAWLIDDEGVVAGETVLVDRGRPLGMLLDGVSASALGKIPTGHGRRSSYLEAVRSRMGCTFIEAGNDVPQEILSSTRSGVFIRRLVGGHTDPVSGRASFIVSDADRIVDGRLAEPLDVFIIELFGRESWASIDRVGDDLAFDTCIGSCVRDGQPIAVSVGAPTIRIGVVRVSS